MGGSFVDEPPLKAKREAKSLPTKFKTGFARLFETAHLRSGLPRSKNAQA
jgi:hypothetical protein